MKKLGKGAIGALISGISITLVGIGLFILNFSVIPVACIVGGLVLAIIGTPYINGVEYPRMLEEQHIKRNLELANKREYVKNNINKFGIGANITPSTSKEINDKSQVNIDEQRSGSVLAQITYEQENQEIDDAIYTLNTMQQEQREQVLTKKMKPVKKKN